KGHWSGHMGSSKQPGGSARRQAKMTGSGQPARGERSRRAHPTEAARGAQLVSRFMNGQGVVAVDDVAKSFGMSKGQLAETVAANAPLCQARHNAAQEISIAVR